MSKKHSQPKPKNTQKWLIPILLVAVVAIITGIFLLDGDKQSDSLPATINVSQAAERFDAGAFLLDVRTQEEWNQGHIDGAVLIPLDTLASRVNEIPADQDVLIICRSGNRSGQARDLLRAQGLARTTSIAGGINAWISSGLPVVTGP